MISCTSCGAPCEDDAESCPTCGRPPATSDPRIGRVIADRYEVRELLGRGGMGVVYKAYDRLLEEVVALKLLRGEMASPELARRFRDEIRFARRVSHRNVCRIHEYGESGTLRYISMAFVDGIDLKHVLAETGPLPPDEALETGRAVAAGLQAIHDEGIVHRDLKTANIMRDRKGVVRLMDFGIAKDWSAGASGQTATGVIVGTPEYMSPEQALGRRIDARSDLYSLGVVLYELFTAHVPFRGDTPMATLLRHIQEPLRLDTPEAALLPQPVRPVVARALAKSPDERFSSASELGDALAAVQRDAPLPLPTPLPATQRPAWPTRTREAAVLTPQPTPTELVPPTRVARAPQTLAGSALAGGTHPGQAPHAQRTLLWVAGTFLFILLIAAGGVGAWWVVGRVLNPAAPADPRLPGPIPSAAVAANTPAAAAEPTATREVARVAPTPLSAASVETTLPRPTPTRVVVAQAVPVPPKPPAAAMQPDANVAPVPRPDAAAARAAWEEVARAADDATRPESERMAELRRFLAASPSSPYRAEAAGRLARLEEDVRRRLLARPDPATLGRQRRAIYVGGTLTDIAEGTAGTVAFPDKERMVLLTGGRFTVVPFRGVSSIEYGLTDRMRGMVFKKKSHYLSLTYHDAAGETQGMVLELSGDEFRPVLTQLEARTGQKVQYQDEKAARERWQ